MWTRYIFLLPTIAIAKGIDWYVNVKYLRYDPFEPNGQEMPILLL